MGISYLRTLEAHAKSEIHHAGGNAAKARMVLSGQEVLDLIAEADKVDQLKTERDALKAALDHAAQQLVHLDIDALRAENEKLREERDEFQRLHKLRGEALRRPCMNCGYQPKALRASGREV